MKHSIIEFPDGSSIDSINSVEESKIRFTGTITANSSLLLYTYGVPFTTAQLEMVAIKGTDTMSSTYNVTKTSSDVQESEYNVMGNVFNFRLDGIEVSSDIQVHAINNTMNDVILIVREIFVL